MEIGQAHKGWATIGGAQDSNPFIRPLVAANLLVTYHLYANFNLPRTPNYDNQKIMEFSFYRNERVLLFVILILGSATAWMTANRLEGYNFVYSSYQDLYEFTDDFSVQGFKLEGPDTLNVRLAEVDKSSRHAARPYKSVRTSLQLVEGQRPQFLTTPNSEGKYAFWTMWGENVSPPLIGNVDVPVGRMPYRMEDFVTPMDEFSQDQVDKARNIAMGEFGVRHDEPSTQILRSLAVGLHQSLFPHRGSPDAGMRLLNGFQQYEAALAGKSGIYCENHAEILAFFANAVGVPTRVVGVAGKYDGVALGAHAFVESYIKETGRWMYIDLQLNIFGVTDESSKYLSAADIIHRMASKSSATLTLQEIRDDDIVSNSFASRSDEIGMFIHPKATLVYLWGLTDRYGTFERLARFFFNPQPGYSLRQIGFGAQIRICCTYILAGLIFIWGVLRLRHMYTGEGNPPGKLAEARSGIFS